MEQITDEKICVELVALLEERKMVNKIPKYILNPISNKATQSKYKLNVSENRLKEVSNEAFSLFVFLYTTYIANNDEKNKIKKMLKENEYKKRK